jgi:hypothetical protein
MIMPLIVQLLDMISKLLAEKNTLLLNFQSSFHTSPSSLPYLPFSSQDDLFLPRSSIVMESLHG